MTMLLKTSKWPKGKVNTTEENVRTKENSGGTSACNVTVLYGLWYV